jgi:peptidoglycan/LPS O-acetylase OafA/YrhL
MKDEKFAHKKMLKTLIYFIYLRASALVSLVFSHHRKTLRNDQGSFVSRSSSGKVDNFFVGFVLIAFIPLKTESSK